MRKILTIAWTDIKIEFSERSTLIFFLVLPIVFTVVVGMALGNTYSSSDGSDDTRLPVLVVDNDRSQHSMNFLQLLSESPLVLAEVITTESASQVRQDNESGVILVIPDGFQDTLLMREEVDLIVEVASANTELTAIQLAVQSAANRLDAAVSIADQSVLLAQKYRPFSTDKERALYFDTSFQQAQEWLMGSGIRAETQVASRQQVQQMASSTQQASSGQMVTWVLTTLLGGSSVFVNERIAGTLRRLMITPTHKSILLTGKILSRFLLGLLQMTLLVGFGALFLSVNWGQSIPGLILMMVSFGLVGTALGVTLGAFSRTRSQASGLTVLISMLLAALGGAWWPLEITPPAYQQAVKILPSTWAMIGFNDLVARGQGLVDVLPEAGILLGFACLIFLVGLWRLRVD
jgi:ABC-2 type transport system permease protein